MHISKLRIENYKCFREASFEFGPGFNVIVGQNAVGKTALLEASSLQFSHKPHRTTQSVPNRELPNTRPSVVDATLTVANAELRSLVERPGNRVLIPIPEAKSDFAKRIGFLGTAGEGCNQLYDAILAQNPMSFTYRYRAEHGNVIDVNTEVCCPTYGLYDVHRANNLFERVEFSLDSNCNSTLEFRGTKPDRTDFGVSIEPKLRSRVYYFHALRAIDGICSVGPVDILASSADNLAEVLDNLQGRHFPFNSFNQQLNQILPSIKRVSVAKRRTANSISGNARDIVEVMVAMHDSDRFDLDVPLKECGSGVSQVLAILYVAQYSDYPQAILIDEPQSFLHPGAIRRLLRCLSEKYSHHQYIVATHSTTVLNSIEPSSVYWLVLEKEQTRLTVLTGRDTAEMKAVLLDIGASLSDVFGADCVLWVEGPTEEICFPKLLEQVAKRSLGGLVVKAVLQTGDFQGRDRERVISIYEGLSKSNALIPPAIGYFFDDEGTLDQKKEDLRKLAMGRVFFTARRMYENYLLSAEALAERLGEMDAERSGAVKAVDVDGWLTRARGVRKYVEGWEGKADASWWERVHAAKLLKDLFSELTETRVQFDKTRDSVALTGWLIANDPEFLRPIVDEITTALTQAERKTKC